MTVLRGGVESLLVGMSLSYFGAMNLVGFRFLIPGRYTYGAISIIGLVVIGLGASARLAQASIKRAAMSTLVALIGLLPATLAFGAQIVDSKDYFIVGFGISVVSTVYLLIGWWRDRRLLVARSGLLSLPFYFSAWTIIVLGAYFSEAAWGVPDLARFLRQQAAAIPFSACSGIAAIEVVRRVRSHAARE